MEGSKIAIGILIGVMVFAMLYGVYTSPTHDGISTINATTTTTPGTGLGEPVILHGPASDGLTFVRVPADKAANALLSGEIDYYLSSIAPGQAISLRDNPNIRLYYAASQINGIILNPAPAPNGSLNPFSLQKVRFAVQYIIDRERIVDEIHHGFGTPILVNMVPNHPSYALVKDAVEGLDIVYDADRGNAMIKTAMEDAGAVMVGGKWTYEGNEIVLSVIIPYENVELNGIGDAVSSELESAGFNIDRVYMTRYADSPSDYTDPGELVWNAVVTGWVYYGHSKYEGISFPELERKEGWWVYNNSGIETVKQKLNNYSSMEEWAELNKELAKLYLEDSVGIWVTGKNNVFAARSGVQGLTDDRYVGLRSYGNAREAFVPGKRDIAVGSEYTYEDFNSWNPVVIESISMMDVVNTIQDPPTWDDPKTLEKRHFRASYSIDAVEQDVPRDAFVWNYAVDRWVTAGSGRKAKSKVTYDLSDYIGAKWHHGTEICWADMLYNIASFWDAAYDKDKSVMSGAMWKELFEPIVGLRIDGNRLEVYLDKWSFNDGELLVLDSVLRRSSPLELFAAIDKVVYTDKTLVYDKYNKPKNLDVRAMSLVNASHVQIVLDALDGIKFADIAPYITVSGKTYASEEEFKERSKALKEWNVKHNHLIIGNGPFYMEKYDRKRGTISLKAFRDPSYPFKKGDWREDARNVRVLTEEYPPYNYADEDGAITGMSTDIVKEILTRLKANATIEMMPWSQGYGLALNTTNIALYSTARTPQREGLFKWVGPIARYSYSIYAKKDSGIVISSLDDAKRAASICVNKDYSAQQLLSSEGFANLDLSTNDAGCIRKLADGTASLWVGSPEGLLQVAKGAGVDADGLVEVYALNTEDLYVAFSNGTADDIVRGWQKTLDGIKKDGTYGKLMKKYTQNPQH
ncbi:MAG: transporter substrate-binding domain-containing protein [Candidatus Altiarchaeota archaeon]|nr:transporter substrate-binding domain-containing protein [Candidatus Altiarchaeota archaeon]